MTPVLLDQNSIFRVGVSLALVMSVVFIGGYCTGYQKAVSGEGMDLNRTMVLALPKPAHADVSGFEPYVPEVLKPGADIDVDSPEGRSAAAGDLYRFEGLAGHSKVLADTVIEQTMPETDPQAIGDGSERQHDRQLQLASLSSPATGLGAADTTADSAPAVAHPGQADRRDIRAGAEPQSQAVISNSANAEDARYTIQVGVFADAENAMRKKDALAAQQLTAYVNEYRNKRDQPRFNVRFGYFKDKSSASAALTVFEQSLSGAGYVTRIR